MHFWSLFCYGIAKGDKMLEYLRNAADKPVAKVLMGILIFSFVGWGVAEWVFGLSSNDTTLMRVGDSKISVQQYNAAKSMELSNMPRAEQRTIYTDPVKSAEFQRGIVKKLSTQTMLSNHANSLGYVVSDHGVANEIRKFPEFQQNGKFSPIMFQLIIQNSGYSETDFANIVRDRTLRTMVLNPIEKSVAVPAFVINAMYNARYGERAIDFTTVKFSDFNVGTPTDENLREYYAQNPQRIAETRNISYALIGAEMDKPDLYEAGLKAAQKLEDDIIAGETLSTAAKNHRAKYVKYENISNKNLPNDKNIDSAMMSKIFTMDENTESELIETKNGFMIVRVDKITPEHNAAFESIKSNLVNDWRKSEQKKRAYVRANEILTELNKSGKMPNKKSATVSRAAGAPTDVLVAAFKNPIKNNSIVPGQNEFYVLHIDAAKKPLLDTKKMQNIKTDINNMSRQHIQDDFNSFLMRKYPMKLNEKTYNRYVK